MGRWSLYGIHLHALQTDNHASTSALSFLTGTGWMAYRDQRPIPSEKCGSGSRKDQAGGGFPHSEWVLCMPFNAFTLLVRWQEGPVHKKQCHLSPKFSSGISWGKPRWMDNPGSLGKTAHKKEGGEVRWLCYFIFFVCQFPYWNFIPDDFSA